MVKAEVDSNGDGVVDTTTEYLYDADGLRIVETTGSQTREYLFDKQNPTGYAQVLEEYVNNVIARSYSIGHDVIGQYDSTNGLLTFLYDGHGSTRALVDGSGAIDQVFAYDAYGNHLAGFVSAAAAKTSLLYSGEWTNASGEQYLRARWYDPATGRFNRLDPFAGNSQDPQSLHKYLYCHDNPVSGIDPSGKFTLQGMLINTGITAILFGLTGGSVSYAYGHGFWSGFLRGSVAGAVLVPSLYLAYVTGGGWKGVGKALAVGVLQGGVSGDGQNRPRRSR